jgi:flagellar hook protein FlgE
MIRSMSTALSGLRNHQVMIDVVGNDIANVSTVGFKGSVAVFSDVLSQTLNGVQAPGGAAAGTNPAQIGLGSRLVGTQQSFTQGAIQRTERNSDVAIQGDGFFVVGNGDEELYTRAGSFNLDANGRLSTIDGTLVKGWQSGANGVIDTNAAIGQIEIRVGDLLPPDQTTSVGIGGNLSANAPIGAQADMSTLTYDEQGRAVTLNLSFVKTAANQWTASATAGGAAVALTNNVLTFGPSGELVTPAGRSMGIAGGLIAGMPDPLTLDLGTAFGPARLTQFAGDTTSGINQQNGSPAGSLQSFDIAPDGVILGSYSNGRARAIGQLAMAVFANPGGLERVAGAWRSTPNSGLVQIGTASTGGRGMMLAGSLEMSNVDLAEEFTRLIVAQRGFQGNARVITASDEVLQEVVNLKR